MPSAAHNRWNTDAQAQLDELEAAHRAVSGVERGRRFTTQQINHAYAMLLSAQFQGFCRDLHSEVVDKVVQGVPGPPGLLLRPLLTQGRKLDSGNPNPGNVGSDFGRFGIPFWDAVKRQSPKNLIRMGLLEGLNAWRNAIAHQDFSKIRPLDSTGRTRLRLADVKRWRTACSGLADAFNQVAGDAVHALVGQRPW